MLRFTIRDVLWLTVVVALALAWRLHNLEFSSVEMQSSEQRNRLLSDYEYYRTMHERLSKEVKKLGVTNDQLTEENERLKKLLGGSTEANISPKGNTEQKY
jgi:hypothetical protein